MRRQKLEDLEGQQQDTLVLSPAADKHHDQSTWRRKGLLLSPQGGEPRRELRQELGAETTGRCHASLA